MSNKIIPHRHHRFFLTFQRYISASTTPPAHTSYRPSISHNPPRPIPHSPLRHATIASSPSSSSTTQPSHQSPPRPRTHYDLFPLTLPSGPPPSGPFPIDLPALKREFLQLQAKAHPDRHSGPNKARAEGTSALINEAYKTLQDPLRRAQYLLQLQGIDVAEDETLKIEDPELLMQVLECREVIEGAESEEELVGVRKENEGRIEGCVERLKGMFERGDVEGAKGECVRLRYWVNVRESVDAWEKGKPVVLVH